VKDVLKYIKSPSSSNNLLLLWHSFAVYSTSQTELYLNQQQPMVELNGVERLNGVLPSLLAV